MRGRVAIAAPLALLIAACATGPRPAPQVRTATPDERALVARVLTPLLIALEYSLDRTMEALRLKDGCLIGLGVLVSDRLNAAVGPGRTTPCAPFQLLVTDAALKTLPEPDLQAMLAHELGHVHLGHFAQAAVRQRQQESGEAGPDRTEHEPPGDRETTTDSVTMTSPEIAKRALKREDEAEADQFAAALLRRVGGERGFERCLALAHLFDRLEARSHTRPAEWLATHPLPGRRADATRADCEAGGLALPRER